MKQIAFQKTGETRSDLTEVFTTPPPAFELRHAAEQLKLLSGTKGFAAVESLRETPDLLLVLSAADDF